MTTIDKPPATDRPPTTPVPVLQAQGTKAGYKQSHQWGCTVPSGLGCLAGIVVLGVIMCSGVFMLDDSVRLIALRAQQRLVESLPQDLESEQRTRILLNLKRLSRRLDEVKSSDPLLSGFLGRAGKALDDDLLTSAEVAEINAFLEEMMGELHLGRRRTTPTPTQAESKPAT